MNIAFVSLTNHRQPHDVDYKTNMIRDMHDPRAFSVPSDQTVWLSEDLSALW